MLEEQERVVQGLEVILSNLQNVHPGEWTPETLTAAVVVAAEIARDLNAAAVAVFDEHRPKEGNSAASANGNH